MDESSQWGVPRYATLAVVVMLHAAVFAALLMSSRILSLPVPQAHAVELLFLAPASQPKPRRAKAALLRSSADTAAITLARPVLDTPSLPAGSAPGSSSIGAGPGVDWAAEARRALQAFEIRNDQPPSGKSVSGRPEEDNWLPSAQHRAGEQLKTANGDWIVWINANCYEIASSGPGAHAVGTPETICRRHSGGAAQ